MGGMVKGFGHLWDRILGRVTGTQLGGYQPSPPRDTGAPSTDTAANLQNQQDQLRNMQRGVLANIYAGNSAAGPTVATRQLLGS